MPQRRQGFMNAIRNFFLERVPAPAAPAAKIVTKKNCTLRQQSELEYLCGELFKKKSLVTSGRLQLIGLDKIKRQMGNRWEGLQSLVYSIADEVITENMQKGDFFVRFRDDTYIVIFGGASKEECSRKANLIADSIRRKLFDSGAALQGLSIERHVVETRLSDLQGLTEGQIIETIASAPAVAAGPSAQDQEIALAPAAANPVRAEVADYRPIKCTYLPLWDVEKNALTTYLCEAEAGPDALPGATRDVRILRAVADELRAMGMDGRKFYIVCPVRHETLYSQESFARYVEICERIPQEQRELLAFMVTDMRGDVMKMNGCWFMSRLRGYCGHVFADLPLRGGSSDFMALRQYRFDAVGFRLDEGGEGQASAFEMIQQCAQRARDLCIPRVFALDIGSLSLATSAVCHGINFMGGEAIHATVAAPDSLYRYKNENLFAGFGQK